MSDKGEIFCLILVLVLVALVGLAVVLVAGRWDALLAIF
jgi:hypothetical protein